MDKLRVQATGFPATTETFKFMVEAYESIAEALAKLSHPDTPVILSGVQVSGNNVSDGFIAFKGELYRFVGGPKTDYVVIKEDVTSVEYNTDIANSGQLTPYDTYFKRYAMCDNPGTGIMDIPFSTLRRIDDLISISDRTKPATTAKRGVIELATQTEVNTGTDNTRAVTPATLANRMATETRKGVIEIATQAEVDAGTDHTRAVTPATLAGMTYGRILHKETRTIEISRLDNNNNVQPIVHGEINVTGLSLPHTNYAVLVSTNLHPGFADTVDMISSIAYIVLRKELTYFTLHWRIKFEFNPANGQDKLDVNIIVMDMT